MNDIYDDFDIGPQSDEFRDEWDDAMDGWGDDDYPDDYYDDGEALASAGFGTDEDYE
jgi:hypothetical protein